VLNKKRVHAASVILFAGLIFMHHAAISDAHSEGAKPKAQILFFQHAKVGSITKDKINPSCYHIQLSQLKPHVIYFADQPARTTGTMTWPEFAVTWNHNELVEHIHPNAVIHALANGKTPINDTVILSSLQYDNKNNTVSYKACALDAKKMFITGQLTDVSVFIDPFHPWP
jgi:hypothetical protein